MAVWPVSYKCNIFIRNNVIHSENYRYTNDSLLCDGKTNLFSYL